jgi:hypothetical protein
MKRPQRQGGGYIHDAHQFHISLKSRTVSQALANDPISGNTDFDLAHVFLLSTILVKARPKRWAGIFRFPFLLQERSYNERK